MIKVTNCMVAVTIALTQVGCAAGLSKMNPSQPIAIDTGFFAARYKQDGNPLAVSDVADQLESNPETASDASRGRTLRVISSIVAGVGGALVGIPVGQAIVGEREPLWALAGAGGAAIAVSIPLAIWSDVSMDSAVEAHNRSVASVPQTAATEGAAAPGPRAQQRAEPAPPGALGFVFGASKEKTAAACEKAGHEWSDAEGAARCSGTVSGQIPGAAAQLELSIASAPAPSTIRARITPPRPQP